MVMEFYIFSVVVINFAILFPLIRGGVTDVSGNGFTVVEGNGVTVLEDMVPKESSPDGSKVMVHNTFHLSKLDFDKLRLPTVETVVVPTQNKKKEEEAKKAESNQWDTVHNQFNTWTKIVEVKINSLMKSNEDVLHMLTGLEKNFDRISNACDLQNEKLSNGNNENGEMIKKLDMVHRHIANSSRMKHPDIIGAAQIEIVKRLIDVIAAANKNLEHFSPKQLIQVFGNSEESLNSLKELTNIVHSIDKRTTKLLDVSTGQHGEMISRCQLNEKKLNAFSTCINSSLKEISDTQIPKPMTATTQKKGTTNGYNDGMIDALFPRIGNENQIVPRTGKENQIIRRSEDKRVSHEPNKYNCHDLNVRRNGIYKFASLDEFPNEAGRYFYERYCDFNTDGVAWTVIQRRFVNKNQENFNRTWSDYKFGFGKLDNEFWFGNEFIHKLTFDDEMELRIILEDSNGREEWAEYSLFRVESEEYNYNLMIGGYRGSIPDSFIYHNDQDFSTYDRQNDNSDTCPCAASLGSGWWYNNCTEANLNGHDGSRLTSNNQKMGKIWHAWLGNAAVKSTKMMIRPKDLWTGDDENLDEREDLWTDDSTKIDERK